jgi:hypothetical protein
MIIAPPNPNMKPVIPPSAAPPAAVATTSSKPPVAPFSIPNRAVLVAVARPEAKGLAVKIAVSMFWIAADTCALTLAMQRLTDVFDGTQPPYVPGTHPCGQLPDPPDPPLEGCGVGGVGAGIGMVGPGGGVGSGTHPSPFGPGCVPAGQPSRPDGSIQLTGSPKTYAYRFQV